MPGRLKGPTGGAQPCSIVWERSIAIWARSTRPNRCCAKAMNCGYSDQRTKPTWRRACSTWAGCCIGGETMRKPNGCCVRRWKRVRACSGRIIWHRGSRSSRSPGCWSRPTNLAPRSDGKRDQEFEQLARHALEIQRRELGGNHRDVGLTLTLLTMRLMQTGKQAEAEKMLLSSLGVFVQQEGGKSLGTAMLTFQRAARARQRQDFVEANKWYRSCLDTIRTALGDYHPLNSMVLTDLAGMLRRSRSHGGDGRRHAPGVGHCLPRLSARSSGIDRIARWHGVFRGNSREVRRGRGPH